MKIVFICPPGPEKNVDFQSGKLVAAVQQQIFGLSKELSRRGHSVFIIRRWNSKELYEHNNGIILVNIPLSYPFLNRMKREDSMLVFEAVFAFLSYFFYSIRVINVIKKIKPDIVNLSSLLLGLFVSKFVTVKKVYITHSHDIYVHNTPYSFLKKLMLSVTLSSVDKIIALTSSIKVYLENMGFKIDAIIPNAVEADEYFSGKGNDGQYVLYAGRLVKHKRVIDLIDAFSFIKNQSDTNLVIIGEGPEKQSLEESVSRKNLQRFVKFLPFLPEEKYREAISNCSIFVLPSVTEAFGVVIIEAMACGRPVIARRTVGPVDIITHGHDGFLFKNKHELKECLTHILSDDKMRKKMGLNARKTIESEFSYRKIGSEYERFFESLIEDSEAYRGQR